jgi:hypothetical protein
VNQRGEGLECLAGADRLRAEDPARHRGSNQVGRTVPAAG